MEILSPAGNFESLKEAVCAGCNAVYLGCQSFSARAGAGNFSQDELLNAVAYAHLHHVKVYVTVNILVKDSEIGDVGSLLSFLNKAKVDAVLVQDLGVLHMMRKCFPDLPVHASTQMTIHNRTGAVWCSKNGMERVVLARECSISEIRLAASADIDTEVFVHGAQCVCVSGQCLFSSQIGCRSGNRGRCAQPCRLDYTFHGKKGAWLSPRDVCMRDFLPELNNAGVDSLKIEGRLKRPEYVAQVTSSYSSANEKMNSGNFSKAKDDEMQELLQIFNRGGFMQGGYAMGNEDAGVIYTERVNHCGVPIGKVISVHGMIAQVLLAAAINDQDELEIHTSNGCSSMIYSGKSCCGGETATVRIRQGISVKKGDQVWRLTDSRQLEKMRLLGEPAIPVKMHLKANCGEKMTLEVTDGENTVFVTSEKVEPAEKKALSGEEAEANLRKTGGTPFEVSECIVETEGAFVPLSRINQVRRNALDELAEKRQLAFGRKDIRELPADFAPVKAGIAPNVLIFRNFGQISGMETNDFLLCWHPEDYRMESLEHGIKAAKGEIWLELPTVCEEDTLQQLNRFVNVNCDRISGVILGSVGQLGADWKVDFAAGQGIPVMNTLAAELLLEQGCKFVTASPEMCESEIEQLVSGTLPVVVPSYGRQRLMLLHNCPQLTYLGMKTGHSMCSMCDSKTKDSLAGRDLTDRKGVHFPLLRERLPEGCLVQVMNSCPTDIVIPALKKGWKISVSLTDEEDGQAKEICTMLGTGEWRTACGSTSGHLHRMVE